MILLIDNYDSFVHNLARYLEELGCRTEVVRNDRITLPEVREMSPAAIVLSPGPCTPRESGVSLDLVRELGGAIPMLGVCLGHQVIAAALGGVVVRAREPVHGQTSLMYHNGRGLFQGLENPFRATRYHSLVVDEPSLPPELQVTARTADDIVMALEHREWPLWGVQFHPESVLTAAGPRLLANFLRQAGLPAAAEWHDSPSRASSAWPGRFDAPYAAEWHDSPSRASSAWPGRFDAPYAAEWHDSPSRAQAECPAGDFDEPPAMDTWRTSAHVAGRPLTW